MKRLLDLIVRVLTGGKLRLLKDRSPNRAKPDDDPRVRRPR